jgi:hypothetical protein
MEINGRIWGSLPLAVKIGVDFRLRLLELHLGRGCDARSDGRPVAGVRSRNLGLELVWIASVLRRRRPYPFLPAPRRRDALTAALRLPWPRDGFATAAIRCPPWRSSPLHAAPGGRRHAG